MPTPELYSPRRTSRSEFIERRRLKHHVRVWDTADEPRRTIWMLHGWMDVSASFQFLVDCLPSDWRVLAPDWRGYGLSQYPNTDSYCFADYLGDLDQLMDAYSPGQAGQLVAHSMGGNVAMIYAGVRPERVAGLVNLEGLGLSASDAALAPKRYAKWLGELRDPPVLRPYDSLDDVARRLRKTNPRLRDDYSRYLAQHWAHVTDSGKYELQADPAHKVINANLYRADEVVACWKQIAAPVMLMISEHLEPWAQLVHSEEYKQRLASIPKLEQTMIQGSGHMLHHDQPEMLAGLIREFFERHC